jgi:hypothetical protein
MPANSVRAEPTWRDDAEVTKQYAGIRHTPQDSQFTFPLAVARRKKDDEIFWSCALVAHDQQRGGAEAIMARHRLKGGREQLFKEVLRGLDLRHPPCESLTANRMFYVIAALACNLMKAVQLICLPDECQSWTVPPLLQQMVRLPATLARHARRRFPTWVGRFAGSPATAHIGQRPARQRCLWAGKKFNAAAPKTVRRDEKRGIFTVSASARLPGTIHPCPPSPFSITSLAG